MSRLVLQGGRGASVLNHRHAKKDREKWEKKGGGTLGGGKTLERVDLANFRPCLPRVAVAGFVSGPFWFLFVQIFHLHASSVAPALATGVITVNEEWKNGGLRAIFYLQEEVNETKCPKAKKKKKSNLFSPFSTLFLSHKFPPPRRAGPCE